jgi:hypothetical protein
MFELTAQEKGEVVANCDHLGKLKYARCISCHGLKPVASEKKRGIK